MNSAGCRHPSAAVARSRWPFASNAVWLVVLSAAVGCAQGGGPLPTTTQEAVAAGPNHSCASLGARVYCWGAGANGELGNEAPLPDVCTGYECRVTPTPVEGLPAGTTSLAANTGTTCALTDGGVWCWGSNVFGQLGNDDCENRSTPVQPLGLAAPVTAISDGGSRMAAVMNGHGYLWGNACGLSSDTSVPTPVSGLPGGVRTLAVSAHHACAGTASGVLCFGDNEHGQLGDGTTDSHAEPRLVTDLHADVTLVAVGENHSCALANGDLFCWGAGDYGKLGNGGTAASSVPVRVDGLPKPVTALALAQDRTCVVAHGGAYCWGSNPWGAVGDGTDEDSAVPVPVVGLSSGVTAIASGLDHSCAIASGKVWCWGLNYYGVLGYVPAGSDCYRGMDCSLVPVEVSVPAD